MTEEEEFEFRARLEKEKKQPTTPAGEIPGAGPYVAPAPTEKRAGEPSYGEKALQYATAVPAGGLIAGGLRAATAGTKFAPYAATAAEALIPKTLPRLAGATTGAAAAAVPAEFARSQAEKRGAGPTGQTLAEIVGGGLGTLPFIGAQKGVDVLGRAFGGPTRESAKGLRQRALGELREPIGQTETELSQLTAAQQKAQQEAARQQKFVQRAEAQIGQQPQVSAQRAAQAPLTAEQQTAALQAQVRQPVRETLGAQRATAEQRAAEAQRVAAGAQESTAKAQQAVANLEQQLLSKPTTTAEEFGRQLRAATDQMTQDLMRSREEISGLGKILQSASKEPNISTQPLIARAQALSQETRNPNLLGLLDEVQALAKTGDKSALSLNSADSLRKTLSKDIINKYFAQLGADRETLRAVRELRRELMQEMPKDYIEALGKFRTESRKLDIVERNGALAKVRDVDALSTAEKLTEAQVVGEIINKARVGHPTFSRLLEVSPQLKDPGRLYFTQDLFGKGAVPTEAALRTWLKVNERPLRQLGLYDEFRSIRTARETAQRAVNEAKLAQTEASMTASFAQKEAERARGISEESASRLASALKTTQAPTKRPSDSLAEALRRVREPAKEAEQAAKAATLRVEEKQKLANSLRSLDTELTTARNPKEIASAVDKTASEMVRLGVISEAQRKSLVTEIQGLKDVMDAQTRARKQLGYLAGLIGVGYAGRGVIGSVMESK